MLANAATETREGDRRAGSALSCPVSTVPALVLQWSRLVHRVLADLRHFGMVRRHPDDVPGPARSPWSRRPD